MGNWFSDKMSKKYKRGMAKQDPEEKYEFPATLDEFGYYFNNDGKLRNKENDEPFEFAAKPDNHRYNQKRYEALGDIITEHIYLLMEKKYNLKKRYVPECTPEGEPRSFVYHTDDVFTNEKMIILIHGSGAVRAGQWARRLIINDCLDSGTQLPFISRAIDKGYSVIVANTNINKETIDGEEVEVKGNSSPEEHVETLWSEIVQKSKAEHIGIIAHSYGGVCTLELANSHINEFWDKVFAIALTDSVHSFSHQSSSEDSISFYKQRARNWASAYDPLDTPLETRMDFCPTVSAGTDRHDYTSYSSMESIFEFLEKRYTGEDKLSTENRDENKKQSNQDLSTNPDNSHLKPTGSDEQKSQDKTESVKDSQKQSTSKMTSDIQQPMSQESVGSMDTDLQEKIEMSQDTVGSPGTQQGMSQDTVGSPRTQQEMSQDIVGSPGTQQQEMSQDTVGSINSPQQMSQDEPLTTDTTKSKEEL